MIPLPCAQPAVVRAMAVLPHVFLPTVSEFRASGGSTSHLPLSPASWAAFFISAVAELLCQ